jgi:hypothetical protein
LGFLKTLNDSAECLNDYEEKWVKKFMKNDKKKRNVRNKKDKLKNTLKIPSKKKFLEDNSQIENTDIEERKSVKKNKEIRWKVPINTIRNISENERKKQGIFGRMLEYMCIYLPSKVCPQD